MTIQWDINGGMVIGTTFVSNETLPPTNGLVVEGFTGLGTSDPQGELHVKGTGAATIALEGSTHCFIEFYPNEFAGGRKGYVGFGSSTNNVFWVTNEEASAGYVAILPGSGAGLGVNTSSVSMASMVNVNGNLAVGANRVTTAAPSNGALIEGNVGIGTVTNPQARLHVQSSNPQVRIDSASSGATSISTTSPAAELICSSLNTTSKYLPAIKWMTTDPDAHQGGVAASETNPKILGWITARATETYNNANAGGVALDFAVNPNQVGTSGAPIVRMIIDQTGFVGITNTPATNPLYRLDVVEDRASQYAARIFHDGNNANRVGLAIQCGEDTPTSATSATFLDFLEGDGTLTGRVFANNTGVVSYADSSDERKKKNIAPTKLKGLSIVKAINLIEYQRYRVGHDYAPTPIGFSAQNLREVFPSMVQEIEDGSLMISKADLIPVLVKAVQELAEKLDKK